MNNKLLKTMVAILSVGLISCGGEDNPDQQNTPASNCTISKCEYEDIATLTTAEELEQYQADVADNRADTNGIIVSPYYTMKINGEVIPVYATRSTNTIHSFAYIDVDILNKEKDINLFVEITISDLTDVLNTNKQPRKKNITVLPESKGVVADLDLENRTVEATITKVGDYSFVFNKRQDDALTLMVAEKIDTVTEFGSLPVVNIEPGDYTGENADGTVFNLTENQNKVYFFKKGNYQIDSIKLTSNSIAYFEPGCHFYLAGTGTNPLVANSATNLKILGRGLFDYAPCMGSYLSGHGIPYSNNKSGIAFNGCTNLEINSLIIIDAQTWQCCINVCEKVHIQNCLFFGYRTYADGIMLNNCKDSVVEYNFIRTGDDAFETKSTSSTGLTDNVLFQYNSAWTDKAVAYGCIYESTFDTRNVTFKHNSVGFALGTWSRHLGSCVIQMGNRKGAWMANITFEDIEIFKSDNQGVCNIYIGGSGGMGEGWGNVDKIYFKDITCKINSGSYLNLQTYENEYSIIGNVYLDNIVCNDVKLTEENRDNENYGVPYINHKYYGAYRANRIHINTRENISEGE